MVSDSAGLEACTLCDTRLACNKLYFVSVHIEVPHSKSEILKGIGLHTQQLILQCLPS